MRKVRTARLVGLGAALLMVVGACGSTAGGGSGSSSSPQHGGNLRIATVEDPLTMDKTQMFDNESIWIAQNIYDELYEDGPDGKTLVPALATSYTLSADKLTWTFHLRPGVKFSNGHPVTSADVKFSIDEANSPNSQWQFIDAAIASVATPDPSTVAITTRYPWSPLLADLALFGNGIVPANYGGETKDAFYQHPVGTGPFQWNHWTKGQELELTRNPHYWKPGKPYLNSVTWAQTPDDNTRILQLKGGQVQVDEFPPYSAISSLQSAPGITMSLFPSSRTDYVAFNEQRKPFQDPHVRRAVADAIDQKAVINAVLFGHGQPANSFLTPALIGYDKSLSATPHDLAKAKSEMAQSTVPNGFSAALLVGSGDVNENSTAQILQSELKPLGINLTIQKLDSNAETQAIETFNYDVAFEYDTTDIIDPDELVQFAVGGEPGGNNSFRTHYNNPQINQLIAQAERTFDKGQRAQLYAQVQKLVQQDQPIVPLYYSPFPYAYSTKLHSFQPYPTGNYHLENMWLSH